MTSALEVSNLTRRYGPVTALDDVSLTIEKDAITGLLGRNGVGKSVLMSLMSAQDMPTAGGVLIGGVDPQRDESVLSGVSFVRDNQGYPSEYRLPQLLRIAPVFHPNWDAAFAARLIDIFAIPTNRTIRKFSRGQLSAVAALIGLASRAPITFFDEPYLGMDATSRVQFYDLLLADYAEHPRTILISTHLIDEMEPLLENVIVLDNGRVRRTGSADELRSLAHTISGPRAELEAVLAGEAPLKATWLGAMGSILVESDAVVSRARAARLDVGPATLQELVAAWGLGQTTDRSAS